MLIVLRHRNRLVVVKSWVWADIRPVQEMPSGKPVLKVEIDTGCVECGVVFYTVGEPQKVLEVLEKGGVLEAYDTIYEITTQQQKKEKEVVP